MQRVSMASGDVELHPLLGFHRNRVVYGNFVADEPGNKSLPRVFLLLVRRWAY